MTLILGAILLALYTIVFAVPTAFALMLFLGNIGLHVGFLGCVPGAVVIRGLRFNVTTKENK